MKGVFAYVRATDGIEDVSVECQIENIKKYCNKMKLKYDRIIIDNCKLQMRKADRDVIAGLGFLMPRGSKGYPGLLELISLIASEHVCCILVDVKLRLFASNRLRIIVEMLCKQYDVSIIETANSIYSESAVAIYHYGINPIQRPAMTLVSVDKLYLKCISLGWSGRESALFLDYSEVHRGALNEMRKGCYECIFVDGLYHIQRDAHNFLSTLQELGRGEVYSVVSLGEGILCVNKKYEDWFSKKYSVAVMKENLSGHGKAADEIASQRMRLFVRVKTNWVVTENEHKAIDTIQETCDLVLVDTVQQLCLDTRDLADIMTKLGKPVLVLSEGVMLEWQAEKKQQYIMSA